MMRILLIKDYKENFMGILIELCEILGHDALTFNGNIGQKSQILMNFRDFKGY